MVMIIQHACTLVSIKSISATGNPKFYYFIRSTACSGEKTLDLFLQEIVNRGNLRPFLLTFIVK